MTYTKRLSTHTIKPQIKLCLSGNFNIFCLLIWCDINCFWFNWKRDQIRVFCWEKSGLTKAFEEVTIKPLRKSDFRYHIPECLFFFLASFKWVSISVKQEVNKDLSQITWAPGAINKVNISHPVKNTTITCYWTLAGLAWPPSGTVNESTYF